MEKRYYGELEDLIKIQRHIDSVLNVSEMYRGYKSFRERFFTRLLFSRLFRWIFRNTAYEPRLNVLPRYYLYLKIKQDDSAAFYIDIDNKDGLFVEEYLLPFITETGFRLVYNRGA